MGERLSDAEIAEIESCLDLPVEVVLRPTWAAAALRMLCDEVKQARDENAAIDEVLRGYSTRFRIEPRKRSAL